MRLPGVCVLVLAAGCFSTPPGEGPPGAVTRALGCETNADCADDNPCNQDWCAYDDEAGGKDCRHSEYNTVAGCCYAPALDPATGLAWDPADQTSFALPGTAPNGMPDAREAYGAVQCDDKKLCTPNGCDVEGGDFWAGPGTALPPYFGVRVGQGGGSLAGPATGEGILAGFEVALAQGPLNDSNDLIAAAPGTGACEVLRVAPADPMLPGALAWWCAGRPRARSRCGGPSRRRSVGPGSRATTRGRC
ncbi:MAG: hypothetical protein FJ087_14445 [Deltaproteobacteria bacterium]|nr:hypothetical protein [Deltaproteobacteria bacterium]